MSSQRTITSVKLTDLFPAGTCDCIEDPVEEAIEAGRVRRQFHPTEPLAILNYTEACAYEGAWTPVTLACRGLIYRTDTGEVVARPLRKFFNYGQPGAPLIDLDAKVAVTDKQDGSLGIIYPTSAGWAVATRGSFTSEQALHATEVLRSRYPNFTPPAGITVLVEIVFPSNRIVVDYGDFDDLVLLGAVDIATGLTFPPTPATFGWPGPATAVFPYLTLAEALAADPRPNAEGLVVHCVSTDERIKIKQADYVALHKIVTGLNARVIWQHLIDGKSLDELVAPLPDEFHPWCRQVAADLVATVDTQEAAAKQAYAELVAGLPEGFTRKDFAAVAVPRLDKWAMFLLLDGRDIRPELWKHAKPEPFLTPSGRTYGEDTA